MALKDVLGKVIGDKRVALELDLARGLLVARPRNPLQAIQLINSPTLAGLREQLAQAASDERVAGLIVHAAPNAIALAHLEEVVELIEDFGRRKPTVAWAESFGELVGGLAAYRLACAAEQIWVQPTGMLSIHGMELQILLLRGMLEKFGLEPQFRQRHEYKTAGDTYAAERVTEANREMTQRIGQSIMDILVAGVAERRGLATQAVWDAVNAAPVEPQQALELGLIDRVGYRDEVYQATLEAWGLTAEQLVYAQRYTSKAALAAKLRPAQPKVAVITLRGAIVTGRGAPAGPFGGEQAGADVVDEHLRAALRDDHVKAVVFEVESPGGSAVASDFIRRSVLRLRDAGKPVVAHMGTVAGSGGYYVAMGANEIVAQATTLTGSIGVVGGKVVTAGLYDKLGLIRESVEIGDAAAMFSPARQFTADEWERLEAWLDRVYRDFTTLAAKDRGMKYEELEAVARGRVWTGADALQRGLVDHLGGQRLAVERACRLAGISPETARLERIGDTGLLELLWPSKSSESVSAQAWLPSGEALLGGLAERAGLVYHGALTMPFRPTVG